MTSLSASRVGVRGRRYLVALLLSLATLVAAGPAWAQAQSPAAAVQLFNTAVNAQNDGNFQFASQQWDTFLERYAADPLAGKALHYSGTCKLQLGDYAGAAAQFEQVIANHADLELLEETYLNLAWCQYSLGQAGDAASYAAAAETFASLAEDYADGSHVAEARFFEGESLYQMGQKEESIAAYAKALEAEAGDELRAKVLYALGSTQQEVGQNDAAMETYATFLEEFPEHALVTDVELGQAQALLHTQQWAEAEAKFGEVTATEGFGRIDFALNQQAHCAAQQQKYAAAADLYARLANEFPDSSYAAGAVASAGAWYYQSGDFAKAQPWLARAAEQGGAAGAEAAHWLCQAYLNTGQPEQALEQAEASLATAGDVPFAANLELDRGDALDAIEGRREEALAAYREFAEENSEHALAPRARYNAAFAAMSLGQYDEGLADAETFLAAYPEDALVPDVKYVQAECYRQQDQPAEAEAIYAELVEGYPDHTEIEVWQSRLGLVAFLQEKYAETIAALEPVAAGFSDPVAKVEALYLLGASQFYQEQYAAAAATLGQVPELAPEGAQADDALLLLARAQAKEGQGAEAIASATRLLADYPESPVVDQAYYWRGDFHSAAGDAEAAAADYATVIADYPDSIYVPYAINGQAWAKFRASDFAGAGEAFTTLLETYPEHELAGQALRYRAQCRQRAGEYEGVIADIDAYLAATPEASDKLEAVYLKGLAQVALDDHAAAVTTFASIVPEDPAVERSADILYQLAWAQRESGDEEASLATFARLASEHAEDPRAAEAHFHLGQNLYASSEYAEAVEEYTTAKEMAAGRPIAENISYKLGWSHYNLEDYAAALAEFSWQLENFPTGSLATTGQFMQAECQFLQGEYEEALAAYTAIRATPPNDEPSQALLLLHGGQSAAQLENWDEAVDWLSELIETFPDSGWQPQAQFELGRAQMNLQQYDEALASYEEVALLGTALAAEARFMMGEIYFLQQEYAEAIEQFQHVIYFDSTIEGVALWQAQSGVEAGQCELVLAGQNEGAARQEHLTAARRFFQGVIDKHPGTDEAAAAATQLERVGG